MTAPRVFIWVQHLFGQGHVRRMARLAKACEAEYMAITVAAGGPGGAAAFADLKGNVIQLPPLKTADAEYTGLVKEDGIAPDDTFWEARQEMLIGALHDSAPDILLIELFPFGRRKFAREMLPLIKAARALEVPPLIISSVRDIVEPKSDTAKTKEMASWLSEHFDAVLVHGDERLIRLEATAPFVTDAHVPIHYTGLIAPPPVSALPKRGVVVSAGSGPSGTALINAAAEASPSAATAEAPWHLFVPQELALPEAGTEHLHIKAFSPAFIDVLARAEISVSEAGYNTVAEALAVGAKLVLAPYSEASQTEQPTRAKALADAGIAVSLGDEPITPQVLLSAVSEARQLAAPASLNLEGAKHSAVILNRLHQARSGIRVRGHDD